MDESVKTNLLERFRAYLDSIEGESREADDPDFIGVNDDEIGVFEARTDLYSLFVELAGLRTEVRTESRLLKDALDQFRIVLDQVEKDRSLLEQQVERARAETRDLNKTLLRPLLLELLDLRDRLQASAQSAQMPTPTNERSWRSVLRRLCVGDEPQADLAVWHDGQKMTLRRLDRILLDRQVVLIDILGQPFDSRCASVVSTVERPDQEEGLVVEIARAGFLWKGNVLRPAEVIVNKLSSELQEG